MLKNKTSGKITSRRFLTFSKSIRSRHDNGLPRFYAFFFSREKNSTSGIHLFESGFAAEADLAGIVNVDDFDRDQIAFAADIGDFVDPVISHFGDVKQTVHAGENFDKSTEIPDGYDFTAIDFADFGFSGACQHPVFGGIELLKIARHDFDGTVFFNVNTGTGFVGDGTDILTTGTDKGADFIRIDFDNVDSGSPGADISTGFGDSVFDDIEDL